MWSDPILTRKWMNIWKSTKVYRAFRFLRHAFWKEKIEDRVKLLELNVLKCCLKMTKADLRKIGLKMKERRFRELSSWVPQRKQGHIPHYTTPLPPLEIAPLAYRPWMRSGPLPNPLTLDIIHDEQYLSWQRLHHFLADSSWSAYSIYFL